jgi:hypothetical protein
VRWRNQLAKAAFSAEILGVWAKSSATSPSTIKLAIRSNASSLPERPRKSKINHYLLLKNDYLYLFFKVTLAAAGVMC